MIAETDLEMRDRVVLKRMGEVGANSHDVGDWLAGFRAVKRGLAVWLDGVAGNGNISRFRLCMHMSHLCYLPDALLLLTASPSMTSSIYTSIYDAAATSA